MINPNLFTCSSKRCGETRNFKKTELGSDKFGTLAVEAAETLASAELRQQLVNLQRWWDVDPQLLASAIAASG